MRVSVLGLALLCFACCTSAALSAGRIPVFIDTDIGSDVDDSLALLTVLGTPSLELVGVSTVYGETGTRARIARRLLELAGHSEVPVGAGVGSTLLRRKKPRDWTRELRQHLDVEPHTPPSTTHGIDLLIQAAEHHPGLRVLAIGPLTNIAVAILKAPWLVSKIGQLVVVGGATHLPPKTERGTVFVDYKSEYNLNCDPEAATVVFESGIPIVMSGLAPALQVTVGRSQLAKWKQLGTPVSDWIVRRVTERLDQHASNETHLGDVLGCVVAFKPEVATIRRLPVSMEMWGQTLRTVIDPTGTGTLVDVVLSVDRSAFDPVFREAMHRALQRRP